MNVHRIFKNWNCTLTPKHGIIWERKELEIPVKKGSLSKTWRER